MSKTWDRIKNVVLVEARYERESWRLSGEELKRIKTDQDNQKKK